ncbi:hypothetical protein [Coprobacter sp.]
MNKNKNVILAIERMPQWAFLLILLLFQFIFVPQGLDFADEGFFMTFYQQIFNDPESVTYAFMYWFTGILGGTVYSLFPGGGILMMRFAGVLIITLTAAVTCRVLKSYLPLWAIRIGVAMSVLYIFDDVISLYYNNVSALLYVTAVGLLLKGLRSGVGRGWIMGSGMLFSLNIFTRIPNILGILFTLIILYEAWIFHRGMKWCVRNIVYFLSGYFSMFFLVCLSMWKLGHLLPFLTCLDWVFHIGGASGSSHNIFFMLRTTIGQYLEIGFSGLFLTIWGVLFFYLIKRYRNKLFTWVIGIASFLLLAFYLYFYGALYPLYFLSLVTILFLLWIGTPEIKIVALAALLLLVIQPLGSDGAVDLVGRFSMWLALPLVVTYIGRQIRRLPVSRRISDRILNRIGWVAFLLFVGLSVQRHISYTYFDQGSRFKKIYSVDHPFLRGIYTSRQRASLSQEVISALDKYVSKDDYTLIYDNSPILHYLTKTKPYVYNPWVYLYDKTLLRKALLHAEKEHASLPVVVLQKFKGLWIDWPDGYSDGYMADDANKGKNLLIKEFLKKNEYKKTWTNGYYEIWIPRNKK